MNWHVSVYRLQGLTDGFDLGMNTLLDGEKEDDDGGSSEPRRQSAGRRKHQKGGKRKENT